MILCSVGFMQHAYAQTPKAGATPGGPKVETESQRISGEIVNPFKLGGNLIDFFMAILNNIILPIGGIIAVLAFIWAGFLYVTAQGNPTQISKAHSALLHSAIGTALLVGSGAVALIIQNTINQLK
ncbi:hypothetical protein BH11PAT3_BH11PAT3_3480 [soil metagenome]